MRKARDKKGPTQVNTVVLGRADKGDYGIEIISHSQEACLPTITLRPNVDIRKTSNGPLKTVWALMAVRVTNNCNRVTLSLLSTAPTLQEKARI